MKRKTHTHTIQSTNCIGTRKQNMNSHGKKKRKREKKKKINKKNKLEKKEQNPQRKNRKI